MILALLLACGETEPNTDDSVPVEADTDTDADADTDTDYAEGCLEDHGIFSASTRWDYHFVNTAKTGAYTVTVEALDTEANTATLKTNQYWGDTGGNTYSAEETADYSCDVHGLYLEYRRKDYSQKIANISESGFYEYVYEEPELLRPNDCGALGDTWTATSKGTLTTEGGSEDFDYTLDYEVLDEDIPRGDLGRACEITYTTSTGNAWTYYWIEDVGLSWDLIVSLDSHTP
jgi:hypothetical protein